MPTAALIDKMVDANILLVDLVEKTLAPTYATLDLADVETARDVLIETGETIVRTYGPASALLASQFYDDVRDTSPNALGKYRASLAPEPDVKGLVDGSMRWAVAPLFGALPDEAATLERVTGALSRHVLGYGRDTIAHNVSRDPAHPRWARVPRGLKPCDFCLDLASRGAAYSSRESASARKSDGNRYHEHCHCVPVAIFDGDPYPTGYDPDALYEDYQARQAEKTI